jgi:hypothetical protein
MTNIWGRFMHLCGGGAGNKAGFMSDDSQFSCRDVKL